MKKQLKNRVRQLGITALVLGAIVALDGGQMEKARAGIVVEARIQMPNLSVQYQSGPRRVHRTPVFQVTARDRAIARRLAFKTGLRGEMLLDLRSRGLSWNQIGQRLGIPRGQIRFAMHHGGHHYKKGPHHKRVEVRCGTRLR